MGRKKLNGQSGSILVIAVVLSFATVLLGLTFLTSATLLQDKVSSEISLLQSIYDAYAFAMVGVADKISGRPHHAGFRSYYDKNYGDYRIIAQGERDVEYGLSTSLRILGMGKSESFGLENRKDVLIEFAYETYADWLYISSKERDAYRNEIIRFWTPDTLDGKVHSNDTIHISMYQDRPVFKKRVTTTSRYIDPPYNNARFDKGWGYRDSIVFPDQAYEIRNNSAYNWGTGSGLGSDSITEITFSGRNIYRRYCGPYEITSDSACGDGDLQVIRCDPPYIQAAPYITTPPSGALFIRGKVWIKAARGLPDNRNGQYWAQDTCFHPRQDSSWRSEGFEGQLTVASSDTMIITDHLIYKRSRANNSVPSSIDSCPDVLGLISENYIMIGEDAGDTVYVNAAMAAIRGSISVQDIYENFPPGWDNERQSLFIWGSLAQRNRGIVRTTDNPDGHVRGFREKDYHYDIRLKENPPPHFLPTLQSKITYMEDFYQDVNFQEGGGD